MNILGSILLIAGGILAVSPYMISKKPESEKWISNLIPFNAWTGILMFALGVWNTVHIIFNLGSYTTLIKLDPFWGFVSMLFAPFMAITVGFMLGFALVARWISGKSSSEEKLLRLRKKLITMTTPMGFLTMLAGILQLFRLF